MKKALLGFVFLLTGGVASASNVCGAKNEISAALLPTGCTALHPNEYLESPAGRYRFYIQSDGNLVLYDYPNWKALWSSGTNGKGGNLLQVQTDGNVVLYRSDFSPVWSNNTGGKGAALTRLILTDEPKLVIEHGQNPAITTIIYAPNGPGGSCTTARAYPICVFPNSPSRFTSFVLACNAQEAAAYAYSSGAVPGACAP